MSTLIPNPVKREVVENLTVDAAMAWVVRHLAPTDPTVVNKFSAYVRVRDAQGQGVAGLGSDNFTVTRISDLTYLPNNTPDVLTVEGVSPVAETLTGLSSGMYVLSLSTPIPNLGLQEYAFIIRVDVSTPPGLSDSFGIKLVSTAWNNAPPGV
jgi:hypothetical protein